MRQSGKYAAQTMRSSIKPSCQFCALLVIATLLMAGPLTNSIDGQPKPPEIEKAESFQSLDDILHYIHIGWTGCRAR